MPLHYAPVAAPKIREVVISRNERGDWELVNPEWPKKPLAGIRQMQLATFVTIKGDIIDFKLANARGIYRIVKTDVGKGLYTLELVYSEEPESHATKG